MPRDPGRFEQADLEQLVGPQLAQTFYRHLLEGFSAFQINTNRRQALFLAHALHESGGLRVLEENLNYSAVRLAVVWPKRFAATKGRPNALAQGIANNPRLTANTVYALRNGNGPVASGDGWRFRGQGIFQLTGRANYRAATAGLKLVFRDAPDLLQDPGDLLQPRWAALSACWFWANRRYAGLSLSRWADLNNETALLNTTRAINGGLNGLEDRRRYWRRAQAALGV